MIKGKNNKKKDQHLSENESALGCVRVWAKNRLWNISSKSIKSTLSKKLSDLSSSHSLSFNQADAIFFSGKTLEIPDRLKTHSTAVLNRPKSISDVIDVVGNGANQPVRKRKAALEQSNVLKKIKNKQF